MGGVNNERGHFEAQREGTVSSGGRPAETREGMKHVECRTAQDVERGSDSQAQTPLPSFCPPPSQIRISEPKGIRLPWLDPPHGAPDPENDPIEEYEAQRQSSRDKPNQRKPKRVTELKTKGKKGIKEDVDSGFSGSDETEDGSKAKAA
ncbi:hypothetical protein BT69DRAFT_1276969 [Atractiella rhizophila]|nr:hypothetical protein BT69DRAFT_1276969 [Atractiella rhizophila]